MGLFMNTSVFTYGSLMFDEVWQRVVRGHYRKCTAVLWGYRLCPLRNEMFPAIVQGGADDQVSGFLYSHINAQDLLRLDNFEGDYYRRETVMVSTANQQQCAALVYVLRDEFLDVLGDGVWDAKQFRSLHLANFIKQCL